ncbi:MAG: N-acetyltransferase [Verrucomicrobia bacterium]|nr:N-acetyltransferase [Verrucomicrobiota bacterium]
MPAPSPRIRSADAARDAVAIAAIYAPNVTASAISFEETPPTAAEMSERIVRTTARYPWLVADTGEGTDLLGYVYAVQHQERASYRWAVNVTVYIAADQRRRGVGRALYASLFALLRLAGFHQACGGITQPNAGSVGLHESLGFRLVGIYPRIGYKFGQWHDVGWWQLELQPADSAAASPPAEPLFDQEILRAHPGYLAALNAGLPFFK